MLKKRRHGPNSKFYPNEKVLEESRKRKGNLDFLKDLQQVFEDNCKLDYKKIKKKLDSDYVQRNTNQNFAIGQYVDFNNLRKVWEKKKEKVKRVYKKRERIKRRKQEEMEKMLKPHLIGAMSPTPIHNEEMMKHANFEELANRFVSINPSSIKSTRPRPQIYDIQGKRIKRRRKSFYIREVIEEEEHSFDLENEVSILGNETTKGRENQSESSLELKFSRAPTIKKNFLNSQTDISKKNKFEKKMKKEKVIEVILENSEEKIEGEKEKKKKKAGHYHPLIFEVIGRTEDPDKLSVRARIKIEEYLKTVQEMCRKLSSTIFHLYLHLGSNYISVSNLLNKFIREIPTNTHIKFVILGDYDLAIDIQYLSPLYLYTSLFITDKDGKSYNEIYEDQILKIKKEKAKRKNEFFKRKNKKMLEKILERNNNRTGLKLKKIKTRKENLPVSMKDKIKRSVTTSKNFNFQTPVIRKVSFAEKIKNDKIKEKIHQIKQKLHLSPHNEEERDHFGDIVSNIIPERAKERIRRSTTLNFEYMIAKSKYKISDSEAISKFSNRMKSYFNKELGAKDPKNRIVDDINKDWTHKDIKEMDFSLYAAYQHLENLISSYLKDKREKNFASTKEQVKESMKGIEKVRKRLEQKIVPKMSKSLVLFKSRNEKQIPINDFWKFNAHQRDVVAMAKRNQIDLEDVNYISKQEKVLNFNYRDIMLTINRRAEGYLDV